MTNAKPSLYYDAKCRLCNTWLNLLRRIDREGRISYVALQSEAGNMLLEKYNFDSEKADTIVFENNNKICLRSEAIIECLSSLSTFWKLAKVLRIFPLRVRDSIYDTIARNRYKWLRKTDNCEI